MLDTTNYDKLGSLKDLSYSDHDVPVLQSGKDSIASLRQKLEHAAAQMAHAMGGAALAAAQKSLSTLNEELAQQERLIDAFIGHHEQARASMRRAIAAYEELPHRLIDPTTEKLLGAEDKIFLNGQYVTPNAYLAALREQANREREAAAAAALGTMNSEVSAHTQALKAEEGEYRELPTNNTGSNHGTGTTLSRSAGSAAQAGAYAGLIGAAGAGRRSFSSDVVPQPGTGGAPRIAAGITPDGVYRRPPATGPGSRYEPVNDPAALRHLDLYRTPINPRMSSDGPIGGYLPAQVTDGTDPRWSSQYSHPTVGSPRASLSAGMLLGAGGAGASAALGRSTLFTQGGATSSGAGLQGIGTHGFGPGASSPGGISTASALSGLKATGSSTAGLSPAAGAAGPGMGASTGVNTPGAAMRATPSAFTTPTTPGVSSTTGTPGAAGAPGVPGAYAPGVAAGSSSDRKSGKDRVGYQVVRIHDDEPRPITLPEGAGPGTSATMKPLKIDEPDDRWE